MAKKIEIIDLNSLRVTDTISGKIELSEPARDYWYKEEDLKIGRIVFYDCNGLKGDEQITTAPITLANNNAVDSVLTTFTESTFRDFCTANLGKSSPTVEGTPLTVELFREQSPVLAGAYYINSLADLEAAASSVTASEIILNVGIRYVFNNLINIGTKILNLDGASLSASVPGAFGVQGIGAVVIKCVDESVFIDEGFIVSGAPLGNTKCFDFTNPTAFRNFLVIKGICEFNNDTSIINGFKNILIAGNISDSSAGFELDLVNAEAVKFQTLDVFADVTAANTFNLINEGTADTSIEVTACNTRPQAGTTSFNINNATKSSGFINLSGNTSLGEGDLLSGATVSDDNVLSQGNTSLADTIITGETGYNSDLGIITALTENDWITITGAMTFKPSTALGVSQSESGVLQVTRPVKNQRIHIRCQISGDTDGNQENLSAIRLSKGVDGIFGTVWTPLDEGVNFTTRLTSNTVPYETVDVANEGDKYRIELSNKDNDNDIKIYAVRLQIL